MTFIAKSKKNRDIVQLFFFFCITLLYMSVQEKRPAKRRRIQHESRENQLGFQRFNKFFTSPDAPIIFGRFV